MHAYLLVAGRRRLDELLQLVLHLSVGVVQRLFHELSLAAPPPVPLDERVLKCVGKASRHVTFTSYSARHTDTGCVT